MSAAARYFPRAPRYVFRADDETLLRFVGPESPGTAKGGAIRARIRNLSATGIAFVVDSREAPETGELLKIEFTLPNGRPAAWFATVMRVEHKSEWDPDIGDQAFTVIGVRFRQLPEGFTAAIRRSLSKSQSEGEDGTNVFDVGPTMAREQRLTALWGIALLACMALMAIPPQAWLTPLRALFNF